MPEAGAGAGLTADGRLRSGVSCEVRYNAGLQLLLAGRPAEALARFEEAAGLLYDRPQVRPSPRAVGNWGGGGGGGGVN